MNIFIQLFLQTVAVLIAAYLVPGIYVDSLFTAFVLAIVIGLLNAIVKPILIILTLPATIMTLGLFLLIINAFIVYLAAQIVPGFQVESTASAIIFSIVLWLVGLVLSTN